MEDREPGELYRRDPKVNDIFVESEYEDEPEVLESEVMDAFRHISNRKADRGNNIPIELLKAGGDDAVTVGMKEEGMTVIFEKSNTTTNRKWISSDPWCKPACVI